MVAGYADPTKRGDASDTLVELRPVADEVAAADVAVDARGF